MAETLMNPRPYTFVKSDGNGDQSYDAIVIVSGAGVIKSGTVLGKISASGKYKAYDNDAADGTQTAAAIACCEVDATSADVAVKAMVRTGEVWKERLVWGAAVTTQAEKDAAYVDFAAEGLIAR